MRPSCVPCLVNSLRLDAGDLHPGQPLAVTLPLVVPGLVLELVDADLGALDLLDHLAGDGDLGELVGIRGDLVSVDVEHRGKAQLVARLALELLNLDHVTHGDLVLLAAGLDDRVRRHGCSCCSMVTGTCMLNRAGRGRHRRQPALPAGRCIAYVVLLDGRAPGVRWWSPEVVLPA